MFKEETEIEEKRKITELYEGVVDKEASDEVASDGVASDGTVVGDRIACTVKKGEDWDRSMEGIRKFPGSGRLEGWSVEERDRIRGGGRKIYEATVHADKNSTIQVLKMIFNRRGFLRVVHSDRGSHFHNHEVDEFAKQNGINWVFGGPGTAKTQGKAERAIRSIKRSVAKLTSEDPKAWKQLIIPTIFSFNSKIGSIGFSPLQLLYGYQSRSAIHNLVLPTTASDKTANTNSIILRRRERLDEIRHRETEQQLKTWEKRVEKHAQSLQHHHYHAGDLILYQNYAKRNKPGDPWSVRWRGPATGTRVTSKGKVDFRLLDGTVCKGWHSDRLKPFILRQDN